MKLNSHIKKVIKGLLPYGIYKILAQYSKSKKFFFEVQLADHCNLNCIGCSHFSPIADESFLNVSEYEKDCKAFAKIAGKYVNTIHLMGGEPLLHNEICDIIRITRNNFRDSIIKVVTNGILLDRMGSEFWNTCKSNNIVIEITPYPININVKKICDLSLEYGVNVKNYGDGTTYKMNFRKDVYDFDGLQNKKNSFKQCAKKVCHHLHNGKLYLCPSPTYIKYINNFFGKDFKVTAKDYIDIYQVKNIRPILKYLKNPIPFCRYCNIDAAEHNIIWSVSKKEISEWT
jgi:MoaA/NifB/PqqE/SkfB family radical SAM enzyme